MTSSCVLHPVGLWVGDVKWPRVMCPSFYNAMPCRQAVNSSALLWQYHPTSTVDGDLVSHHWRLCSHGVNQSMVASIT